jgi:hypothetical protein
MNRDWPLPGCAAKEAIMKRVSTYDRHRECAMRILTALAMTALLLFASYLAHGQGDCGGCGGRPAQAAEMGEDAANGWQ